MTEINDQLGRWVDRSDRLLRPIEDSMNLVAAIAIMSLMLLGVVQIVLRAKWLFNAPIFGYIDIIEITMPAMAILGFAYCQREGVHIRMDILVRRFEGRLLWAVEAFTTFFTLVIIALLVRYSWVFFYDAYNLGDSTRDAEFLIWPTKLVVPVAFGVCVLRLLIQLFGSLRLTMSPDLEPVGVVVAKGVAEQAQEEIREVMGDSDGDSDGEGDSK